MTGWPGVLLLRNVHVDGDTAMLLISLAAYLLLAVGVIAIVWQGHHSAQERDQRDGTLDEGSAHADAQKPAQNDGGDEWHA
jgi:hypothetical protein